MTVDWLTFWSVLTVFISAVGVVSAIARIIIIRRAEGELAKRLKAVFATDITIYGVTIAFGLATFMAIEVDYLLYPSRALFLVCNIYYTWRLVAPLRM